MEANQLQEVIEKGFKDLRAEFNEKFEKIDTQFERIDTQFAKIDTQFKEVKSDLADVRKDLKKVGEDARLAHVSIENLRTDLSIFDESNSPPLEKRVSALEVRVTNLERRRTKKKSGTEAE